MRIHRLIWRKTKSKRPLELTALRNRHSRFRKTTLVKRIRMEKNIKEKERNEPPCIISNPATATGPLISHPLGEKRGYTKQEKNVA